MNDVSATSCSLLSGGISNGELVLPEGVSGVELDVNLDRPTEEDHVKDPVRKYDFHHMVSVQ